MRAQCASPHLVELSLCDFEWIPPEQQEACIINASVRILHCSDVIICVYFSNITTLHVFYGDLSEFYLVTQHCKQVREIRLLDCIGTIDIVTADSITTNWHHIEYLSMRNPHPMQCQRKY